MRNYRDLRVWNEAHRLALALYKATQVFPKEERFGLTSQIRRAAISIGANLAEGCGRRSDGEMRRFVLVALGSASELSYHLLPASGLTFLSHVQYMDLSVRAERVLKMLSALSARLRSVEAA
jgi:four helix bundle protein